MSLKDVLFGWQFERKNNPQPVSFAPAVIDDGALLLTAVGGSQGQYIDLEGSVRSDAELITRYRDMSGHPDVDNAIDEIVNEMVAGDEPDSVKIILDDLKQSTAVKKVIEDAFNEVIELLDFRHRSYDIIRRWYIDGREYFHVIIDDADPRAGIQEVRYIDPRKIRKIKEIEKQRSAASTSLMVGSPGTLTRVTNEYYIFNDRGFQTQAGMPMNPTPAVGIRIAADAIIQVTSGLTDSANSRILSHLHKAIRPLNQLRYLEDAAIIYRLSRASERRVWKVEVGNLPHMKAEQYMKDLMTKFKNQLRYDSASGEIHDDRKYQTMLEDFWLPVRDGKGTDVDVLPPGTSFNQIDDIQFFKKRFYNSLHVPTNRLDPEYQYETGLASQLTHDEIKFGKFITRLRIRFSELFVKLIEKQLVLKGDLAIEDFDRIAPYLRFDFIKDNYFTEMKEQQVLSTRADLAMKIGPFVKRHYSDEWMRRVVWKQSDEEMVEENKRIKKEANNPQFEGVPGVPPVEGDEDAATLADQSQLPDQPMNPPADKPAGDDPAAAKAKELKIKDKKPPNNHNDSGKAKPTSFKTVSKLLSSKT